MSSPPPSEPTLEVVRATLAEWVKLDVLDIQRIGGGRNSQVYKLIVDPGQASLGSPGVRSVALKAYFRHPNDPRDRLATEYNSFAYLWANGFREIPQPLGSNAKLGWALYQFIEGEKIPPGQATEAEVLAAVDLLGRLRDLSRNPESRKLGIASEACFAPGLIVENVRMRLARLKQAERPECGVRNTEPLEPLRAGRGTALATESLSSDLSHSALRTPHSALQRFLADEFTPFLDHAARWSEARLAAAGQSFTAELDLNRRTLSPSDFGFHNALRQPDSRIFFLDFEYFGWDDPAKMIVDFLLHPAMALSAALKRTFATGILRRFADWPGLRERVESVYPLFGLKWCMIFLNEFLPEAYLRRQFAAIAPADRAALQFEQLAKARQMLERIRSEYQVFPYRD